MTNPTGGVYDPNAGAPLYESQAAINTALAALARVGASDRADAAITAAENANVYAHLDNDKDHSATWLRSAYAKAYTSLMATLAVRLTAAAGAATAQDRDDAATCFGIKGLTGEPASLTISLRDAKDRVAQITDSLFLSRMLDTAIRQDDQTLARAIVERAVQLNDFDLVNQYAAAYPSADAALERLCTANTTTVTANGLTISWRVGALRPNALVGLQDYEIQQAAAGDQNVGTFNAARK